MTPTVDIRPAVSRDVPVIEALMAPEIAAGNLLPRAVDPASFLVAVLGGEVVGAVALSPWSAEVAELGSLVSARSGLGIGAALVEAALDAAVARGHSTVVALTGIPAFFLRAGFDEVAATPWARARGCATLPVPTVLDQAISAKARVCGACPRLRGCGQILLAVTLAAAVQAAA